MREEIKIRRRPEDEVINEIIELEWAMFDKVNNEGGRAGCQDDEWTFYAMRYSQFAAFGIDVLDSYRQDIYTAMQEGRNLLTEKYAYMMEFTDPAYFDRNLKNRLPAVSPAKEELVSRTANILIGCECEFEKAYPALASKGRPLFGTGQGMYLFTFTL